MPNDWSKDFRYPAIQASMNLVEHHRGNYIDHDSFSFCLPVSEKPIVAWVTPGRIALLFVVLGLAGLIAGAAIALLVDIEDKRNWAWTIIALACCGAGILTLFCPVLFQKHINQFCIGERASNLLSKMGRNDIHFCELGDVTDPTITVEGDDHVVVLVDHEQNRLLIEGTAATYRIRASDVLEVSSFEFMNYVGADITCRIDDKTSFRFGLAKVYLWKEVVVQLPFLPFLNRWIKNEILESVIVGLGLDTQTPR